MAHEGFCGQVVVVMLWPATNHTEFKLYAFSFNTHHAAAAAPWVDHRVAAAAAAMLWLYSRTLWLVLKGVNDSNQVDSTTLYTDEAAVWTVYCNYATHSNRKPLMLMDTLGLKVMLCYNIFRTFFSFFRRWHTLAIFFSKTNGVLIF